ncbi:MAG: SapC family protein [Proteobacteria bacterium]|nr:SapC family protein [Pseudomonadota bacterium]
MIHPELHKQPEALDRQQHKALKLGPVNPVAALEGLNAFFITTVEFGDVAKEYPILFLPAGTDDKGQPQIAPVAVFGMARNENLFLDTSGEQPRWTGRYVPAVVRAWPFGMGRLDAENYALCIDRAAPAFSETEGQPLFTEAGEPTDVLKEYHAFTERVEQEVERTRMAGRKLMEMKLLQPKRFDATMPDGEKLTMDGFLGLDEDRWRALTDAEILDLHKSGLTMLVQLHQLSLSNMGLLIERRHGVVAVRT